MGKTVFIQDFFMVLAILLLVHRSYVDKNILLGKSPDIPIINVTAQI